MEDGDTKNGFWGRLPVAVQALSGLVGAFAVLVGALAATGYFSEEDDGAHVTQTADVHEIDPNIVISRRAVLKNGINVFIYIRAHPSYKSARVSSVSGDEVFYVGEEREGWVPVRLNSGNEGWIEASAPIQIIDDLHNFDAG